MLGREKGEAWVFLATGCQGMFRVEQTHRQIPPYSKWIFRDTPKHVILKKLTSSAHRTGSLSSHLLNTIFFLSGLQSASLTFRFQNFLIS
jgi:hypothetical protein